MKKWLTSLENSDVPNTVHQRRALISRNLDFWLLGGFSIFSLVFLFILKSIFSIELMSILQFSLLLLVLKIGIEFPHLLASYKIAYSQGRNFILNHWAVLLLVPLFLIVAFFLIIFSNQKFYTYAQNIIQWLVCAVFFLLGWHRSMQTYGCMIVYSRYDSYELSRLQRSYIKFFLLIIWFFGYVNFMKNAPVLDFYGLKIAQITISNSVVFIADLSVTFAWLGFFYLVVYKNIIDRKKIVSLNFMIAPLALFIWWSAFLWSWSYYLFLLPTFHSLQYFAFIFGANEAGDTPQKTLLSRKWIIFFSLVFASAAFYYLPPIIFGQFSVSQTPEVVVGLIIIFTSLHHYLLDGIIWKVTDSKAKHAVL